MRKAIALLIFILASSAAYAQTGALEGFCNMGGTQAATSGLKSSNYQQGNIPSCTVTVYLAGTSTLATLYSDKNNTPLTNPFTADATGSVFPGHWIFWASTTQAYDVVGSGGISPNVYPSPVPLCTDCYVNGQFSVTGGVVSTQGTSPIQVNGVSGSPQTGAVTVSCPSCQTAAPIVYLNELVGAFTDSSGNVIEPIAIGNGPVSFVAPTGTTQLQLGGNDDIFSDEGGSWTISVNGTNYTVGGKAAPWLNTGTNATQYPTGPSGNIAPIVVTVSAGSLVTIQYVSGLVTTSEKPAGVDANGNTSVIGTGSGASGYFFPGHWVVDTSSNVTSVSNSDGSLTFSPTTGPVVGSINYAHAGTWTALETFNAGVSIPSGQGVTQNTGGSTTNCWNTAGTTSACSGGSGSLPSATGAGQPIASTGAGTTYQALTNMTMDGTNIKSSGAGACPVVGTGTVICLTAAPYYASPYGATSTTGTFAAAATSGTVGSCSTFSANEGVLIAGGATGGWNGTSYIGTVVSCSGTTLTITPAITTAVSGAVVQHDETAAFTSAITALGSLGGTIFLPNAANNVQGVYLVNGALQNAATANAILQMPTVAGFLATYSLLIQGEDAFFGSPQIQTSLNTSGASLFGAYGSTSPHFSAVGLYLKNLTIQGPASGSETLVNGTWMQALSAFGSVQIYGASSGIPATGTGIVFPTIANNVRLVSYGILSVGGFGTAVRLGEHNQVQDLLVNNSTNGVVFDVAPTGLAGDNTPNSISVSHIWCGPPSTSNGPTTVSNCLVAGTAATTIHVDDVDYEGSGGTLVSDPSNLLHGDVNYALNNAVACPNTPTLSGAANLVLKNLNCTTGGVATATQGATTAAHLAVFGSDGHDIVDGGAVPSGGSGTVTDGAGTTTAGQVLLSTTTAHAYSVNATLPVASGGTGTATPGLVAGANVAITGTWPNQTISSTGTGGGTVLAAPPYISLSGTKYVADTMFPFTAMFTGSYLDANTATSIAGANGSTLFSYAGTSNAFYGETATSSIEAEFKLLSGQQVTGATTQNPSVGGIWIWDSTNSRIYTLRLYLMSATSFNAAYQMYVGSQQAWIYSGTGSPSATGSSDQATQFGGGICHLKLSVSSGTLSEQISLDGGATYTTLKTIGSIGTISKAGLYIGNEPTVMDVLSVVVN